MLWPHGTRALCSFAASMGPSMREGGHWGLKSPVPVRWPDWPSETPAVEAAHCPLWPWEPLME